MTIETKRQRRSRARKRTSFWRETAGLPTFPPLQTNLVADVCIVGGGIAGLSTAYLLAKAGESVVVLDDGPLSGGVTGVTTAHLSNAIDDRFIEIERLHGQEGARLAASSHKAAIDLIDRIVQEEGIDCDFDRVDGYLFLPPDEPLQTLEMELEAARRAGVPIDLVPRAPMISYDTGPAIRFPDQGQFHPLKYLDGLVRGILRDGGKIFTGTHADSMTGGAPARVTAGPYRIDAAAVVVATNSPINDRFAIHTKQAPYMTYVIGAKIPKGTLARALYWDTLDPYHYVRVQDLPPRRRRSKQGEMELLIVGGEDHKTGQADDTRERHARLERWARERFPAMGKVEFAWSGQVMETLDGLAFIGRNPADDPNILIATGDSGMGMTHGTIAGMLLTDLILGRPNPWVDLYDPARKPAGAATEFIKEQLNVAAQYTGWVTGGDVESAANIPPGAGAVIRRGLVKLAVYRDKEGILHERSAVCPHLGCIVAWNPTEKTWDCPCHGSRYDCGGVVINGPANRNLETVEPE